MINKRVRLFFRVFLECLLPFGLYVYLRECLYNVFRRECSGWLALVVLAIIDQIENECVF